MTVSCFTQYGSMILMDRYHSAYLLLFNQMHSRIYGIPRSTLYIHRKAAAEVGYSFKQLLFSIW